LRHPADDAGRRALAVATVLARESGREASFTVTPTVLPPTHNGARPCARIQIHVRWTDGPPRDRIRKALSLHDFQRVFLQREVAPEV